MPRRDKKPASPAPKPKKLGRPSLRTPELVAEFCQRVIGGRSVASVCADADMPGVQAVYTWRREDPAFRDELDLAREERKETTRSRMVELADRVLSDNSLDPQRAAVAGSLLFKAEQLSAPRQRVELTGAGGGPVETKDVSNMELARWIAFTLKSAEIALAAGKGNVDD